MKTTKELSDALIELEFELVKKIYSFFYGKDITKIDIAYEQHLVVTFDSTRYRILTIGKDGVIVLFPFGKSRKNDYNSVTLEEFDANDLLTILDELERMKKDGKI